MQPLFKRLRRITSGATWIPEIDGLRFVAVLSVVLFHLSDQVYAKSTVVVSMKPWYGLLAKCIFNGNRGVEIFFVISGFILGRPFARHYLLHEKKVRLGNYYLRRLTRLEPPYIVNLVLITICIAIYIGTPARELAPHLLASLVYLHGFLYDHVSTINGVTWSLEIEVQFYLIVPLLVAFFRIRNAPLRRVSLIAAMLLFSFFEEWAFNQSYWGRPQQAVYYSVFFYLQYFLGGLLLSDLYLLAFPRWRASFGWDIVSLICWPVLFFFDAWWRPTLLPFLILLVCIGAFKGILFPRLFRMQTLAIIGGMCYSIYLWHFFIIALGFKWTKHLVWTHDYLLNFLLQAMLLLPLILLLSGLSYVAVERPCMDPKWPHKLLAKIKAAPAETGTAAS